MSLLENPTPVVHNRQLRKVLIRGYESQRGRNQCSERVLCMDGDVANLDEIEGIDFTIPNQDLIEYIANTFG